MKDFLKMKNGKLHCDGEDEYSKNKKTKYCKNCERALIWEGGLVCPHGISDNW